ncbi:Polyketide synthase-nonribosomal peptide synthetase [Colletotrichum sp. SAR 10_77]|nr:Polyketide synthase-nonribosomal peptide synthetase [Colletotrichum sp. SAR 10_77]KAJ4995240.1 Polyketide synthase-nonribosomal peptide synthetase [Colletotrichum sp. SAR 10_66]
MSPPPEPIAIIGAGCRFPGASDSPSKLWDLLKEPRPLAEEIPSDRFNAAAFYHPVGTRGGSTNVKEAYFITDHNVRHFDAQFFSFPPAEAEAIDPQHRHLLEVVYEALEESGLTIDGLHGSNTACFVGQMCNDYSALSSRDFDHIPKYSAPGIAPSNASSRLSYFFDWHGPTMTIDTACSSSLIALAQAVQVLRAGTSDVAVAAGTNLILDPLAFISESNLGMLSPTGRSRMWDSAADGYARGDGIAAVVLKTLSAAIRDGDTIDCIVREVGCNHDGRTRGITMPSGTAQAALIRDTYARAGLDPRTPAGRCQYFEAHGTGTPAGDPQEASALAAAFFGDSQDESMANGHVDDNMLYVGSIKTVVGHTEGTAGLAGVLKAAMALKHAMIPPNLLLEELSPSVLPHTKHLRIVKEATDWPRVEPGVPRRASVNSFGFGGSNAHAILEAYEPEQVEEEGLPQQQLPLVPLVFSATSEKSLSKLVSSYVHHLRTNESTINLDHLRHTLSCRRSALPVKTAFSGTTVEHLVSKMEHQLQQADATFGARSLSKPSVLGVFTGQGAQWATMGSHLISTHDRARRLIQELDVSLQTLPEPDRPDWNILEELSKDKESSRIGEACMSQPLCTAVQLVLVDLLFIAGIRFTAVVGHSSGEIAAAHAAGFLTPTDAIRIAYYRGLHAKSAGSTSETNSDNGDADMQSPKGAMLAVGTTLADAQELCDLGDVEGKLCVAASNSPSSVTLSGDTDAIVLAKAALDEEGKFTRLLAVDTAYHSHHMQAPAQAFEQSLAMCGITVQKPDADAPLWLSSVRERTVMTMDDFSEGLRGSYWAENMVQMVRFSQAMDFAVQTCLPSGSFNLAIEVGPHPALKKPALETLEAAGVKNVEYVGTLARGKDDVSAVADCLGTSWVRLGSAAVDWEDVFFQYYTHHRHARHAFPVLRGLPMYPWDHSIQFWTESRVGKIFRTGHGGDDKAIHELLGKKLPDGSTDELRWKTVLDTNVTPWLSGHALQGQTVYPAAGYVALAMEAAMEIVADKPQAVECIELADLNIYKAIAVDERAGTDMYVSVTDIVEAQDGSITARFSCRSPADKESGRLVCNARGTLTLTMTLDNENMKSLMEAGHDMTAESFPLVPRETTKGRLADVNLTQFYEALSTLGYDYSGVFQGLGRLQRRLGFATGTINNPPAGEYNKTRPLLFHPAMLDTAIHSLFSSFGVPGDGTWSLQVPSGIRRVTVVPRLCGAALPEHIDFDCTMSGVDRSGSIDILAVDGTNKAIELDGLDFVPFSPFTEKDDKCLFSKVTWQLCTPDGDKVGSHLPTEWDNQKVIDRERVAFYYLRTLKERTFDNEVKVQDTIVTNTVEQLQGASTEDTSLHVPLQPHHQHLLDFAEMCAGKVAARKDPIAVPAWIDDTRDQITSLIGSYGNDPDFNIMRAVGENMPSVIRGETANILEVMTKDNMLADFYSHGLGGEAANSAVALMLQQITNRFPHIDILEVGAGTGGATWEIMDRNTPFATYTYTDVSAAFFQKAAEKFTRYKDKMIFKVFDMERQPGEQGFIENKYDVVVASHCLHATRSLERTLSNLRRLLKPGGFVVVLEVVQMDTMPLGLIMGGLPGWWAGHDDGRVYGPNVTLTRWNKLLKKTGFSGVDTFTPMLNPRLHTASIFCAQAVDERINLFRRPLASAPDDINFPHLVIVGGDTLVTSDLVEELEEILRPRCQVLVVVSTLEELEEVNLPPLTAVLSVADLDSPIFKGLTEQRWKCLQRLLGSASCMLWLTHGARCEEPDSGTMLGLLQSIWYELEHLRSQLLEVVNLRDLKARFLAHLMLQMQLDQQWKNDTRFDMDAVMYSIEPELMLDEGGVLKVLRQKPDQEANDRYNSTKRSIKKEVDLARKTVAMTWQQNSSHYIIREQEGLPADYNGTLYCVQLSTLCSIKTPAGPLFISISIDDARSGDDADEQKVLAVLSQNASTVSVPAQAVVQPIKTSDSMTDQEYLSLVVAFIMSQYAVSASSRSISRSSGTLIIHEPPPALAAMVEQQKGLSHAKQRVLFTSSHSSKVSVGQTDWVLVHPRVSRKALRAVLPQDVDAVLDFSSHSSANESLAASKLLDLFPRAHRLQAAGTVFEYEAADLANMDPENIVELKELLQQADEFISNHLTALLATVRRYSLHQTSAPLTVPVADAPGINVSNISPFTLADWRSRRNAILATVEPVDTPTNLFQSNKTYWLVGLSGDLGQSLVDWMAAHGAANIVISSRSVNKMIPEGWIEAHAERGVTIKLMVNDVTDMDSLQRARTEIESTLPPIRGVANGALVLRDRLFINTDFDVFNEVLRPKTVGTSNLDALFTERDSLDWFVGFTSIVAVVGNYGQSAYSAGNNFVKALINQRRARGLPGSTIDISTVRGVGYVEREQKAGVMTAKMVERIENGAMPMSESDLHQLFAEGIMAGRPGSGRHGNLTSGIQTVRSDKVNLTFWANNLKFSHFVKEVGLGTAADGAGGANRVSVRALLAEVTTMQQAFKVIRTAFTAKLNATLQHPAEQTMPDSQALIDLGMDSLVAVEVRTWFRQELAMDMPMLKILGGATIVELVDDAVDKISPDLLPKVQRTEAHVSVLASGDESILQNEASPVREDVGQDVMKEKEIDQVRAEDSEEDKDSLDLETKRRFTTGSDSTIPPSEPFSPSATSFTTTATPADTEAADGKGFGRDEVVTTETTRMDAKVGAELAIIPTNLKPEIERTEPVSYGQSRFWFLRQYLDDPSTTNVTFYFRITSPFSASGLREALARSCQRHEALRTCFFVKDDTPVQGIMAKPTIQMEHYHVSSHAEAHAYFTALKSHNYALEQGDTLRLVLCEESPTSWYFLLGYHHIVMDGFSWEILFAELQSYYRRGYIPPVTRQYADWAVRQRSNVTGGLALASARKYWRGVFAALPPVLPLFPMAKVAARSTLKTYQVHRASVTLAGHVAQHVRQAARAGKATPFHVHLAVFRTLLFRLTGEADLCIGMADAGRSDPADANVIGLLLDLLPLRFGAGGGDARDQSFAAVLLDVRAAVYAAAAHAGVPFNVLLDDVGAPRSTAWHPLVQALIEYRPARRIEFAGIRGEVPPGENTAFAKGPYDIELNILEGYDGDVTVSVGLQSALYSAEAVGLVLRCYMTLLESLVRPGNEDMRVAAAEFWPRGDIDAALELGTGKLVTLTSSQDLDTRTIPHLLDKMVSKYPDRAAIKDNLGTSLSYMAMSKRVMAIQGALEARGVQPLTKVAVLLSPSVNWACALLAVLRSGAIYVPLDCTQGPMRLQQIVQGCSPSTIIIDSSSLQYLDELQLKNNNATIVNMSDLDGESPHTTMVSTPENLADPEQQAVILFTSGTTGSPKGTLLQHGALVNVTQGMTREFGVDPDHSPQIVLQQSALSFDMSLEQLFLAWGVGGTALIADASIRGDSRALMKAAVDGGVTMTKATPPEYVSWLRYGCDYVRRNETWEFLLAGGDRLTRGIKDDMRSLGMDRVRIFNSYGPAEATIIATKMELLDDHFGQGDAANSIPTGYPLPNYSLYIVDGDFNLLPAGISGEILIGGHGVALGYVGLDSDEDSRLTKAAFLHNPWASPEYVKNGWTKLYRTGDRGHLTQRGELVFDGRIAGDTQVKLRGIRLDLRDVEANIVRFSEGAVSEAVCSLRGETAATSFIVAHVVLATSAVSGNDCHENIQGNESPERAEDMEKVDFLRRLRDKLPIPQYMKPARLIPLPTIPMTVHGKIDRVYIAAMPLPDAATDWSAVGHRELTDVENRIGAVWERLLPRETLPSPLSPSSDFFMLGGNSLMLVEVQAHIRADLSVDISLRDLYQCAILSEIAVKVDELTAVQALDWEAETTPPRMGELVDASFSEEVTIQTEMKSGHVEIILTGATGHLGPYILTRLLSNPAITKIHCIAVRDPQKLQALLANSSITAGADAADRVIIHPGDLTQPDLGLTPDTLARLATTAAAIIHAGAARLSWETYAVLRPMNLDPTHALLRLAGRRHIPVHFVSSGGVFPATHAPLEMTAAEHIPPALGADGYIATKWAAERMLERAAVGGPGETDSSEAGLGVPVRIYRTVRCAGEDPASRFGDELPEDIAAAMAAASVESMTMLDHGGYAWSGWFDLVSVHEVADRICDAVARDLPLHADPDKETAEGTCEPALPHVAYTNIVGSYRVWKVDQLHQLVLRPEIQANMGRFKMVPPQIWLGVLKRSGFPWMMGASEAAYKDWVQNRR